MCVILIHRCSNVFARLMQLSEEVINSTLPSSVWYPMNEDVIKNDIIQWEDVF